MSDIKFISILPQTSNLLSRVRIRGTNFPHAEQFSINFVNETSCLTPQNIMYHFKEVVNSSPQLLIENHKRDGQWMEHKERPLDAFDGRSELYSNKDTTDRASNLNGGPDAVPLSSTGTTFELEFAFDYDKDEILVYNIEYEGHNFITSYATDFMLSAIKAVQVWGDVEKVREFAVCYD